MPTIIPILFIVVVALIIISVMIYTVILFNRKKDDLLETGLNSNGKKAIANIDFKNKESVYLGIDKLKKVLNRNPDDYSSREQLADLYFQSNSVQQGIKELLTILDRNDNISADKEISILTKIGDQYFNVENFDEAYKYYVLVKRKEHSNLRANLRLGIIEVKKEQPDKALVMLRAVHTIEPNNAEALQYMCKAFFHLDKYKETVSCYRLLEKIQPLDDDEIFYQAVSYFQLGQATEALVLFEKIKTNPEFEVEINYYLGSIYRKKKSFKESNIYFGNAIHSKKLRPAMLVEAYYLMADNYMNLHNLKLALANWEAIMNINPKYKDVSNKINMYNGIRSNSVLEQFLVGSLEQFVEICKKFAEVYIKRTAKVSGTFVISNTYNSDEGYIVRGELKTKSMIEQYIFLFIRSTGITGDVIVRTINNKMKEEKINKGICVCCGSYSQFALDFVSSRMIDTLDKEATSEILSQIQL